MTDPKSYRPSNSTEGASFDAQFCDRCDRENLRSGFCPIRTNALAFGIGEAGYPAEWIADPDPRCTAFTPEVPGAVWTACIDRCAQFGDPPCFQVEPGCRPCADCCDEAGHVLVEPLGPNAVVRPLL